MKIVKIEIVELLKISIIFSSALPPAEIHRDSTRRQIKKFPLLPKEKRKFLSPREGTINKPSLINFLGKVGPTRAHASFIVLDVTEGSMDTIPLGLCTQRQIVFTTSDLDSRLPLRTGVDNYKQKGKRGTEWGVAERRERKREREGFLERAFINHESQATPNLPPCFSSLAVFLL